MAKSDFWNFIKAPKNETVEKFSIVKAVKVFGVLLYVKLLLLALIIALKVTLEHFFNVGFPERIPKVVDETKPSYLVFLQSVLFAPILEELLFRLPMRYSYAAIILFPSLSIYLISKSLGFSFFESSAFALVVALFTSALLLKKQFVDSLKLLHEKYFSQIFYFLTLYFAFFHIKGYYVETSNFYLLPILILPHFISGLIYGYIRIKYLVWGSIVMHILHNLILFSLKTN